MKHFKDSNNNLFGFEDNQEIPTGLVEITKLEVDNISKEKSEAAEALEISLMDYANQRLTAYPSLGEFADAWVKNDTVALEKYRADCLAVKAKYPKPAGL